MWVLTKEIQNKPGQSKDKTDALYGPILLLLFLLIIVSACAYLNIAFVWQIPAFESLVENAYVSLDLGFQFLKHPSPNKPKVKMFISHDLSPSLQCPSPHFSILSSITVTLSNQFWLGLLSQIIQEVSPSGSPLIMHPFPRCCLLMRVNILPTASHSCLKLPV